MYENRDFTKIGMPQLCHVKLLTWFQV